jgi:hypothetical protein
VTTPFGLRIVRAILVGYHLRHEPERFPGTAHLRVVVIPVGDVYRFRLVRGELHENDGFHWHSIVCHSDLI